MTEQKTIPVSVYVITKDEEANITRLLNNLQNFAEIIIVDSGSTDDIQRILNESGVSLGCKKSIGIDGVTRKAMEIVLGKVNEEVAQRRERHWRWSLGDS